MAYFWATLEVMITAYVHLACTKYFEKSSHVRTLRSYYCYWG